MRGQRTNLVNKLLKVSEPPLWAALQLPTALWSKSVQRRLPVASATRNEVNGTLWSGVRLPHCPPCALGACVWPLYHSRYTLWANRLSAQTHCLISLYDNDTVMCILPGGILNHPVPPLCLPSSSSVWYIGLFLYQLDPNRGWKESITSTHHSYSFEYSILPKYFLSTLFLNSTTT